MRYTTINIHGNLISEEILQKIEQAETDGQQPKDFGLEPGANLRSEIEYAWSRIKLDWQHFQERSQNLPASDPYGTSLTRRWMSGFFMALNFEISAQRTSLTGGNNQNYAISHTAANLDGLPLHIVGFYDPGHPEKNTLDIKSSGGTSRLSPHSTVQEYLNVTEHLYGLATNGLSLRLMRDSGRLVKLTYIECDLKRLLDEDKYSEFTLLYRLLHATRFPRSKGETEKCLLEKYYQDSIESGNRIRDGLSYAVKESLLALGNGLLQHVENNDLRNKVESRKISARDFYHQLLRFIYRLLFLMVTEERDLVFGEVTENNAQSNLDDLLHGIKRPTRRQKEIYYAYYSVTRLRKLSEKRYLHETPYTDLWQGLMQTLQLFEIGGNGEKLGLQALGGDLFNHTAMPDIASCKIDNRILLSCIGSLNEFEDEKHNLSFINYRALDVEELGSVYEGLLEMEPVINLATISASVRADRDVCFSFVSGRERSASGSHYTPEDLVKPLIQHSLEYLIEDRVAQFYNGKVRAEEAVQKLMALKICDVACGSGHILLSAARRLALEVARVQTGEQQPNPAAFRHALKEVIKNCIYGVDKNPLAVELCKVALWLESHNPGEPLNFLKHHIKCGDAIVGLAHQTELQQGIADAAFKTLPGDDKAIAATFLKKNKQERLFRREAAKSLGTQLETTVDYELMAHIKELNRKMQAFITLPENTPEECAAKDLAYEKILNSDVLKRLKMLADLQLFPFFLTKIMANKDDLITDAEYQRYLRGEARIPFALEVKAVAIASKQKFFHWFLEFPEVFQQGGFDCILGNPPFLGGQALSSNFGNNYLNLIKSYFNINGSCDIITYFFRRIFNILKINGFQALISTNSISQGVARENGLDIILKESGSINFTIRSAKWPGRASVFVTLISIFKGQWKKERFIDLKKADYINSFLADTNEDQTAFVLKANENKSFMGSTLLGMGFTVSKEQANYVIQKEKKYKQVLYPFLSGEDLNTSPEQEPERWVINFADFPLRRYSRLEWDEISSEIKNFINDRISKNTSIEIAPPYYGDRVASDFPICLEIVERSVKSEREKQKDKLALEKWWLFTRPRMELYETIKPLKRVLLVAQTTKMMGLEFVPQGYVYAIGTITFAFDSFSIFSILQSNLHESWARKYSSTLETRMRYTPSDVFETFPFSQNFSPNIKQKLERNGETYYEHRKQLMPDIQLGLTKTYNQFHNAHLSRFKTECSFVNGQWFQQEQPLSIKDIEKQFGKETFNLIKHFEKGAATISITAAIQGIEKLRALHVEMDLAVLEAYGWQDIQLKHNFYEVDYLPENDRIRYTIHPDARKEVLKRLLELNHQIHVEEVKAGLWEKKQPVGKPAKKNQVNAPEPGYGLFDGVEED